MKIRYALSMLALTTLLLGRPAGADPSSAWQRAIHFPAGPADGLAARDGYVYALSGWTRGDAVLIFDVRDPAAPRFVHGFPGRGYVRGGAFKDSVYYLPAIYWSVMTIDVAEPERARLLRSLFFNFPVGDVASLAVDGDRLYVGGRGGGLRILDITNPETPLLVAHHPQFGFLNQIVAADGLLILRPQRGESILATVADDQVQEHGRIQLGGQIRLLGSALYETIRNEWIVRDLANPAEPEVSERIAGFSPIGLLAPDQMLAAGPDQTLTVFDVSNPLQPVRQRDIALPPGVTPGNAVIDNGTLVVSDRSRISLRLFDLSGDTARQTAERFIMRNAGNLALAADGHAFLSYAQGMDTTVFTLDLAGDEATADFAARLGQQVASRDDAYGVHDTHNAAAIARVGNYLLNGDGVLDISNPLQPQVVQPIRRVASEIAIRGHLAALAQSDRLTLLDVSKLPERVVLGEYRPEGEGVHLTGVALGEGLAFLVNHSRGLRQVEVLDIRDPANPQPLGRCEIPQGIVAALHENLLYVPASGSGGMTLVDVADPAAPKVLKTLPGLVDTGSYRIRVHEGKLYYTDSMRGIRVADLADPLNPVLIETHVGTTAHSASYTDFEIRDGKLYGLRYSHLDIWSVGE